MHLSSSDQTVIFSYRIARYFHYSVLIGKYFTVETNYQFSTSVNRSCCLDNSSPIAVLMVGQWNDLEIAILRGRTGGRSANLW